MTVTAGGLVLQPPAAQAATKQSADALATRTATVTTVKTAVRQATSTKQARLVQQKVKALKAVSVAKKQVGDPYRYGATGPNAFDCSGLVQFAWKKAGVKIPRVTNSQFARIRKKIAYKNLQPGDLMFFRGLGHVGMYIGGGKMVHSPRTGERVRVEKVRGWRKSSFVGAVRPGL